MWTLLYSHCLLHTCEHCCTVTVCHIHMNIAVQSLSATYMWTLLYSHCLLHTCEHCCTVTVCHIHVNIAVQSLSATYMWTLLYSHGLPHTYEPCCTVTVCHIHMNIAVTPRHAASYPQSMLLLHSERPNLTPVQSCRQIYISTYRIVCVLDRQTVWRRQTDCVKTTDRLCEDDRQTVWRRQTDCVKTIDRPPGASKRSVRSSCS